MLDHIVLLLAVYLLYSILLDTETSDESYDF